MLPTNPHKPMIGISTALATKAKLVVITNPVISK